jgi:type I restriction enzyme S subunit
MKEVLVIKDLGDICHFQNGFAFKSKTFKEFGEPVVRITNIQNDRVESKGFVFVDRNDYSQDLSKYEVRKGDLLIAMSGATTGKIGLYRSEKILLLNQRVGLFKPNQSLDKQYLYYFLSTKVEESLAISAGAAQPNLSTEQIKAFQIPLPPFPEQQRIVSILDKAFAAIDKAKANAEKNLQNAKELFESYLQGVFENGDWEIKEFGKIITVLTDYHANGSYKILKKNVEIKETEDFAWMVRSTDFENDFENDFRYINESGYNFLNKSKVFGGEIIMSKIGNAGNVYLMPRINKPCSLAMNLFLIRLDEKQAISEFVFQYLKSNSGEVQIKSRLQGATTKTITKNNVRNIKIPLPTLNEQETIVHQLNALRNETQKLEAVYQKKMDDLDELKKSILQKAFAGELKVSELGFDGLKDDRILEKDKTEILQSSNPKNHNPDKRIKG